MSIRSEITRIYQKRGLAGLYKGLAITAVRDIYTTGIYFLVYHSIRDYHKRHGTLTPLYLMNAGGLAGAICWIVAYPSDVVKSKIQTTRGDTLSMYQGFQDVVRCSRSRTGRRYLNLFNGLRATIVRGYFANAILFFTENECRTLMRRHFIEDIGNH